MPSIEALRLSLRNHYVDYTADLRKKYLENTDFTIISNNCWGGLIYQSYRLPYNSPTVGLFFMADEYIKFVCNLKYYLNQKLDFIDPCKSNYVDYLNQEQRFGKYPIGSLADIEIAFLHYKNENEAFEKWNRRCSRVNWDNMLIKFNDQNGCGKNQIYEFDNLKFSNKICFTSKYYKDTNSAIFIKSARNQDCVYASQEPFGNSKYVNITDLLNSLDSK